MASRYVNAFDLLRDADFDDEHVVFAPKAEELEYEEESHSETYNEQNDSNGHGNGTENGTTNEDDWKSIPTKVYVKKDENNGNGQRLSKNYGRNYNGDRKRQGNSQVEKANADGSEQVNGGDRRRRGNGGRGRVRGRGRYEQRRVENGEVKELSEVLTEGEGVTKCDAEITIEPTIQPSNGVEAVEEKTEEAEDVPKPEETAEERKKREEEEELKKERLERQRKWQEEEAEEAKKMTLAEYERLVLKKKQELKVQKPEARRVVAADKELESMTMVAKKKENGESVVEKLKKSEPFEKKGDNADKTLAVGLTKLFRPASFRRSYSGGRGRGGGRGDQGLCFQQRNDRPASCPWFSRDKVLDENEETKIIYECFFPVLGYVPPKPIIETTPTPKPAVVPTPKPAIVPAPELVIEVAAKPSTPSGLKRPGLRRNRNGTRGNPPGSAANRKNGALAKN